MGEPMSEERLQEIEARANAATKGPWIAEDGEIRTGVVLHRVGAVPLYKHVAQDMEYGDCMSPEDADFMAHARTDVPDLISEVRRLRYMLDDTREDHMATWAAAKEEATLKDAEITRLTDALRSVSDHVMRAYDHPQRTDLDAMISDIRAAMGEG